MLRECTECWEEVINEAEVLRKRFGIEWRSPSVMNPHIRFDLQLVRRTLLPMKGNLKILYSTNNYLAELSCLKLIVGQRSDLLWNVNCHIWTTVIKLYMLQALRALPQACFFWPIFTNTSNYDKCSCKSILVFRKIRTNFVTTIPPNDVGCWETFSIFALSLQNDIT